MVKCKDPTIMATMLCVATPRAWPAAAFIPMRRTASHHNHPFHRYATYYPSSRRWNQRAIRRHHHDLSLSATRTVNELESSNATKNIKAGASGYNLCPQVFLGEVISFLKIDGISWRQLPKQEIRKVLGIYFEQHLHNSTVSNSSNRVDEMMTFLEDRVILAVGKGNGDRQVTASSNTTKIDTIDQKDDDLGNPPINGKSIGTHGSNQQHYSFILHICPTPNLDSIHTMHQKHQHNSSVAQAVAAYAWLNTHLTNAFFNYDLNHNCVSCDNKDKPMTSIVHLHQDVWNRSPTIVQSRIRNKCGIFNQRIYARQTIVKKIPKSEYIPFLEENHLWGATGAKFGYGLYLKPKKKEQQNNVQKPDEMLIAVATFSSKRKVNRKSHNFLSFELLRFCTKLDTTVVGGLTKLVAAFVREVKSKHKDTGIDIITSIDRDFGSNTWPSFEQMEVMDPIPMFVGNIDGLRRHAVGAGLTPLEQIRGNSTDMSTSMILRVGLPDSLLNELQQDSLHEHHDRDWPWQIAAQQGFHPVFDTGVERLMMVADSYKATTLSLSELWENSTPRYVNEHYSSNAGVGSMLRSIRQYRSSMLFFEMYTF